MTVDARATDAFLLAISECRLYFHPHTLAILTVFKALEYTQLWNATGFTNEAVRVAAIIL